MRLLVRQSIDSTRRTCPDADDAADRCVRSREPRCAPHRLRGGPGAGAHRRPLPPRPRARRLARPAPSPSRRRPARRGGGRPSPARDRGRGDPADLPVRRHEPVRPGGHRRRAGRRPPSLHLDRGARRRGPGTRAARGHRPPGQHAPRPLRQDARTGPGERGAQRRSAASSRTTPRGWPAARRRTAIARSSRSSPCCPPAPWSTPVHPMPTSCSAPTSRSSTPGCSTCGSASSTTLDRSRRSPGSSR